MGICGSRESAVTAKVISKDGRLEEFTYPVKVSYVLSNNPNSFLCNSDEIDFNVVVSPVCHDDELQPGQLYFALPLHKLRRTLHPEEMAALAVKANAALLACPTRNRRHGFFKGDGNEASPKINNGRRHGRNNLSVIRE